MINMYIQLMRNRVKVWLIEIRVNRKIQILLFGLPILAFLLWPASSDIGSSNEHIEKAPISTNRLQELKKLPNLSALDRTEDPSMERKLCRDLFLFEEQKPTSVQPHQPMPPQLTERQLEAEQLLLSRNQEVNSWPSNMVYFGYLGTKTSGRLGAFSLGGDPITIKRGGLINARWRLVVLADTSAKFQNLKFSDLWQTVDAVEAQEDDDNSTVPDNNF